MKIFINSPHADEAAWWRESGGRLLLVVEMIAPRQTGGCRGGGERVVAFAAVVKIIEFLLMPLG